MKKLICLFLVSACMGTACAASVKTNEELLTYKNKNGFEIKHKPCQKIKAMNYADEDIQDLSSLESVTVNINCEKDEKRSVSFALLGETFKTQDAVAEYFDKAFENTLSVIKENKSSIFYLAEKKYLKDNNLLYLYIRRVSKDSNYSWTLYKKCGTTVHALEINIFMPHSKSFESKILSGEEVIPPEEKKIIDSFKCTNAK